MASLPEKLPRFCRVWVLAQSLRIIRKLQTYQMHRTKDMFMAASNLVSQQLSFLDIRRKRKSVITSYRSSVTHSTKTLGFLSQIGVIFRSAIQGTSRAMPG